MNFESALKAMRKGKKVREKCWNEWEAIWLEKRYFYCYANSDKDIEDWEDFDSDYILAEDWEVVE